MMIEVKRNKNTLNFTNSMRRGWTYSRRLAIIEQEAGQRLYLIGLIGGEFVPLDNPIDLHRPSPDHFTIYTFRIPL